MNAVLREEARDLADDSRAFDMADFDIDPKYRHLTAGRWEHYRTCGVCQGSGEVTVNRSHNNDPQCDVECPCPNPDCEDGYVNAWVDPLLRLQKARRWAYSAPYGAMRYGEIRGDAVSPVPLPADRRDAVQAWERAA